MDAGKPLTKGRSRRISPRLGRRSRRPNCLTLRRHGWLHN
ncbi:uncharacterized protein METZ01_LOCUS148841 [marine metagenome]|uniref:Uncharacterized protein n=1 Tax=marine metagenome TaxID=408172 RepID=A0A382A4I1_9ZZZZ